MSWTFYLILANIAVFILQLAFYPVFDIYFALTPAEALSGSYWQFLTYMFLHATFDQAGNVYLFHIGMNMFVLLLFGSVVERKLGTTRFLFLYFISGIGSAILHVLLTGVSTIQMLGASGAVFGVLAAYGILFPRNWIIMFPGIPMPAFLAVAAFAFMELFFGVFGLEEGIANFGHLGGILTGAALMLYWKHTKKTEDDVLGNFEFFWE